MTEQTQKIWSTFNSHLKAYIISQIKNEHDAKDVLQDVFLKIHDNLHKLRDFDRLESWIFQITRNKINDYYRLQKKNQKLTDKISYEISDEDHLSEFDSYSMPDSSWLKPFVDELPAKYRQALVMTEYENKTQREMADELGLSIPGAKSRVQRARKKIKELILACCHFDFDHFGNVLEFTSKKQSCKSCACKSEDSSNC
jgi:RNA polymerase sigma-70 factor, ECF subfamily